MRFVIFIGRIGPTFLSLGLELFVSKPGMLCQHGLVKLQPYNLLAVRPAFSVKEKQKYVTKTLESRGRKCIWPFFRHSCEFCES